MIDYCEHFSFNLRRYWLNIGVTFVFGIAFGALTTMLARGC